MENYSSEISRLRAEREATRKRFKSLTEENEKTLDRFASSADTQLDISYEELHRLPEGELYPINKKVKLFKTADLEDKMRFKAYVAAGGSFGLQRFDTLQEIIVVKGHLIDKATEGEPIYGEGEKIENPPQRIQKPSAEVDSIYDITFRKNGR